MFPEIFCFIVWKYFFNLLERKRLNISRNEKYMTPATFMVIDARVDGGRSRWSEARSTATKTMIQWSAPLMRRSARRPGDSRCWN